MNENINEKAYKAKNGLPRPRMNHNAMVKYYG